MEKLSPMLKQYMEVKQAYPDTLVLYRLGDFYELFFDDAKIASFELNLVLTARAAGDNQKAPMCGVPHHAVSGYVKTLVNNGHKVAIVEQMEDPATAKGIVRRDVVKVVTPGTMTDEWVDDKSKNIIAALTHFATQYFLVFAELISGTTTCDVYAISAQELKEVMMKESVRELIIPTALDEKTLRSLREIPQLTLTYEDDTTIPDDYLVNVQGMVDELKRTTYGRLLNVLLKTQKRSLYHLRTVIDEKKKHQMSLDYRTCLNLELIEPLRVQERQATLFHFLDRCHTAMGSRTLKEWIQEPYKELTPILNRQAKIRWFMDESQKRHRIQTLLKDIYDLERLIGKVSIRSANPQDLQRLSISLQPLPEIFEALDPQVFEGIASLDPLIELSNHLKDALNDIVPGHLRDGDVFRQGYHADLDELRDIQRNGQAWLVDFENAEKERTQIKNLKIGYNRVFGYFIEISKGNLGMVRPEFEYTRKQTLSTGERYITPQLKEREDQILHAQERALRLEQDLFDQLLEEVFKHLKALQAIADAIALLDAIQALAQTALDYHHVAPTFHEGFESFIVEGRHPILEAKIPYVSNTTQFSANEFMHLLTGPNMGGKSTYMRQVALIQVLAQMGAYVPAKSAHLALVDAIFTRMGASDDLLEGHSTFMLEMIEANIALQHATPKSLVLFDEIGRGTSTFDGMALAQAMVEYLSTVNRCKTIFSTHYHELTQLESSLPQVKNLHVEVHEENQEVTFLYRVKHGKADRSYGVNVARLAKLPPFILDRASHLLKELESKKRVVQQSMEVVEVKHIPAAHQAIQASLESIDIENTTPLEALRLLNTLKSHLKD